VVLSADPTALWVLPVHRLAGVARHALDVARTGVPGWRVVFLCPPGLLPQSLRDAGAAVLEAPLGPDHGVRRSVATYRHALGALAPRLVHSHLAYADLVVASATPPRVRAHGPLLASTEHGIAADDSVYHGSRSRSRSMAAAHAARLRRVDLLLAVSEATAGAVRDRWHPVRPVRVVPNGVDPHPHPRPRPGLRILSLARLAPEKRLDHLVRAFALLHRTRPDARLTLAGIGPEREALVGLVGRLGLRQVVDLPGFVDPERALAAHDVLALMSVWENCSYALLDAAAAGLGVVAADVGGNPEIVPTRCLVDARDHPAVAAALEDQGCRVERRPGLDGWPDVATMCSGIAAAYEEVAS
jgi:glycogen(starch) synthase